MDARYATAAAGLLLSLAVSAVLYWQFDTLLLFVVVPFVPFLFLRGERQPARECPECGFTSRDASVRYCPRDGTELE
ncbi:MAG: hypothetical protein ABEH77_04525 [Halobacteriaceae archaeon]